MSSSRNDQSRAFLFCILGYHTAGSAASFHVPINIKNMGK